MNLTKRTALISGASIAGPALAWWLTRYGWDVTVVERAPELRTGGHNIDVRGAGRDVLVQMNLDDVALAATTGEQGTRFVAEDGSTIAAFPRDPSSRGGATAEMEILRGDLADVLFQATKDDARYRFGDSIVGLDDRTDAVGVTFASGEVGSYDLVVIAEGMTSRSRRLVDVGPDPVKPLDLYTALVTIPRSADDDRWASWYNAPGGRAVILRPDTKGTTRAMLSVMTEPNGLENMTLEQQRESLREMFGDAGWAAGRVLDALDADSDMYVQLVGQVKAERWSRGRVALLGDSAYCASPISGMGATLSLVGAYVLAGELAAHVDPCDGLAAYERVLRPWVERVQQLPPGTPRIANPRTRAGITALRLALRAAASPAASRLGTLIPAPVADGFTLPDYSHLR